MTPGWKTTEFWLSLAAQAAGAVAAAGLPDDSPAVKVAGIVGMALTSLGYSTGRSAVKRATVSDAAKSGAFGQGTVPR